MESVTGNATAFRAAVDAAFPGLPEGMEMSEAERRVAAALDAYEGERSDHAHRWGDTVGDSCQLGGTFTHYIPHRGYLPFQVCTECGMVRQASL